MQHSRTNLPSRILCGLFMTLASCSEPTPPPPVLPVSVSFTTDAISLVADDSIAVTASVTMSDGSVGTTTQINYSSSNSAVATVDGHGFIRALAAGNTVITATAGSLHDDLTVAVSWAPITKVEFSVDTATVLLDDVFSAQAVATNSHSKPAPNAAVTYTSSNPAVATVDEKGLVHGVAIGSTTITARDGTLSDVVEITVAPQFIEIAAGGDHSCGVTGKHALYCWGMDSNGSLGGGGTAPLCPGSLVEHCSLVPLPVANQSRFVAIALGGYHSCALTDLHVAYCWGENREGQLGIGTTQAKATVPTLVAGNLRFQSLSAGRFHTCGITIDGDTYCWGRDYHGQLGAGSTAPDRCEWFYPNTPCSRAPLKVTGAERFAQINPKEDVTCARSVSNTIFCWGLSVGGTETTDCQGGGRHDCSRTPLLQVSGRTFSVFGVSGSEQCGQNADLIVWCWGGDLRHFGNGDAFPTSSAIPVVSGGGRTFEYGSLIFGATQVCGLNSGIIECWGRGDFGQAGGTIGINRNTPGPVFSGDVRFSKIVSSPMSFHNCGIATSGRGYCWGQGDFAQLGNGTMTSSAQPALVKLVR